MNFIPSADYAARHPERFPNYAAPKPRPDCEDILRRVHDELSINGVLSPELWKDITAALS
jgi:hypothetical protein